MTRRDPSTTPGGRDPFPVRWRGLGLPPGRASELLAALLLTAVPVILFADCVFGGQMLFQRDIDQYWYGAVQALKECVWNGVPPLWNPFDSFGQPLLGFGPWQILYPTTWLTLLVPSPVWYTMFVVVHVAFTSFGLYRLSRSLDMSWGASLIAGGLWAASGPLLSTVTMTNIFAASCWLPWIALAARHAAESRRLGASLAWGLTVGATVLAGSPGMTLVGVGTRVGTSVSPGTGVTVGASVGVGWRGASVGVGTGVSGSTPPNPSSVLSAATSAGCPPP